MICEYTSTATNKIYSYQNKCNPTSRTNRVLSDFFYSVFTVTDIYRYTVATGQYRQQHIQYSRVVIELLIFSLDSSSIKSKLFSSNRSGRRQKAILELIYHRSLASIGPVYMHLYSKMLAMR